MAHAANGKGARVAVDLDSMGRQHSETWGLGYTPAINSGLGFVSGNTVVTGANTVTTLANLPGKDRN